MYDVAWRGMWICVRSKDAQKQLARTSLRGRGKEGIRNVVGTGRNGEMHALQCQKISATNLWNQTNIRSNFINWKGNIQNNQTLLPAIVHTYIHKCCTLMAKSN